MSLVGRGHCCIRKVTRPCTQADVLSSSEAGRMRLISEMLSGSGAILGTSTRGRTGDGGRALSMMSAMACSLAGSGARGGTRASAHACDYSGGRTLTSGLSCVLLRITIAVAHHLARAVAVAIAVASAPAMLAISRYPPPRPLSLAPTPSSSPRNSTVLRFHSLGWV